MSLRRLALFPASFACLFALTTAFAAERPDWTNRIRRDHPRLFFNRDTWPQVRERALGAERLWYQGVRDRVDRLLARANRVSADRPEELGPEAAHAAFVFLMTGEPRYRDLARQCLQASVAFYEACFDAKKTVNWYSTSRVHAIMAWDWLYNDLEERERTAVMSRLIRVIDRVVQSRPAIYRENMSGYNTGFYGVRNCLWFIGCTALDTGIETRLVDEWLVWGREENLKMLAHRRKACGDDGGGASATLGYVFGAYPWAEQNFFYTWLSSTGENLAPQWPHGAWLANYVIWNWIPGRPAPYQFGYGDTPHDTNRLPTAQLYTHMANIRHLYSESAPEAAALARHIQSVVPEPRYSSTWFIYPFLLSRQDQSPPALSPQSLPHARHFETMGQVFMRSGAGEEDTYALFTCGGILSQHRHYDALNFVLYHRGFLALDSGTRHLEFDNGQHLANYFAQTVAHNCVVIHQPGEPPASYWGGKVEGNHGGQHRPLGSELKAFETNDDFVYVAGDATACYRHGRPIGEKTDGVTRQMVFLMPNHFVIFDRVVTTRPDYRKEWLLHTAEQPVIEGAVSRADHLKGRMFCRTLLPADAQLRAVGGPGHEYEAAGKQWSIVSTGLTPAHLAMMGQWRIEVSPGAPRRDDLFLHVIQVGGQDRLAMDRTDLVARDGSAGVRVTTGRGTWEVAFDTRGALGGRIRRTGGGASLDRALATSVQPQSGILAR